MAFVFCLFHKVIYFLIVYDNSERGTIYHYMKYLYDTTFKNIILRGGTIMSSNCFYIDEYLTKKVLEDWRSLQTDMKTKVYVKLLNRMTDICHNKFLEVEILNSKDGIIKTSLYMGDGSSSSVIFRNKDILNDGLSIDAYLHGVVNTPEVRKMCSNNNCIIIIDKSSVGIYSDANLQQYPFYADHFSGYPSYPQPPKDCISAGNIPMYSHDGRIMVGPDNCSEEYLNDKYTILTLMKAGVDIGTETIEYLKEAEEKSQYEMEKADIRRIRNCAEEAIIQFHKDRVFFIEYSNGPDELTPVLNERWKNWDNECSEKCKNGKKVVIEVGRRDGRPISICAEFKYDKLLDKNAVYLSYIANNERIVYKSFYDTSDYYTDLRNADINTLVKYMCASSASHLKNRYNMFLVLEGSKLKICR